MDGAPRCVVLLSGGLDSATTLALAIEQGFSAHALTIRYGQRHRLEIERAVELARELGATGHRIADVNLGFIGGSALTDPSIPVPKGDEDGVIGDAIPTTYVPGRNTVFLSLAMAWAEVLDARVIFVGVNAVDYSGYPDCRPEYLEAFERMARLATKAGVEGREFEIRAPLLRLSKGEIVRRAEGLGVNLARTISCYDPHEETGRGCGRCEACRLRARGFRDAGLEDPAAGVR